MERFYQIPHTSALFIYLIILKVQYSSDEDFQLKILLHKKYKLFLKSKEVVCWPPACSSFFSNPVEQHEIKFLSDRGNWEELNPTQDLTFHEK